MYIGKHCDAPNEEKDGCVQGIQIPQNYAGNAFSPKEEDIASKKQEEHVTVPESEAHFPHSCQDTYKEKTGLFAKVDRLFSSDTLLILLAILLAGSEDGGELAVILLLLLLF